MYFIHPWADRQIERHSANPDNIACFFDETCVKTESGRAFTDKEDGE